MRHRLLYICMVAEAALLGVLCFFTNLFPVWFSSAAAFPFEQLGLLLRKLALKGSVGNGVAVMLWIGLSFIPAAIGLSKCGDRARKLETVSLCCLSVVAVVSMYCIVNPAIFIKPEYIDNLGFQCVIKTIAGGTIWSSIICCAAVRAICLFSIGDMERLAVYAKRMLYILCVMFVGAIFLGCLSELITALKEAASAPDAVVTVFRFIVSALPYVMDIAVTIRALSLVEEFLTPDRTNVVVLSHALSELCCFAVALISVSTVALNLVQLLLCGKLSEINVSVTVPVMSIAFVLAVLLAARLIERNKQLSDDNDLFI